MVDIIIMEKLNNKPELKIWRKKLRNNSTPAEIRLWNFLKGSQLNGLKFRRQHSFGNYIVDFYCVEKKLVIELDGEIHENIAIEQKDLIRNEYLNSIGIKVLRIKNIEVFEQIELVLKMIMEG